MGRVRGVASGARKTKSKFGSTLEKLSYIKIWFYEKENRELVRVNQCDLIESFMDTFSDYASGVALAVLSEVTETVLPDHEAADANFRLLLLTARAIKTRKKYELPLAYFSMWTVKLGGWLPSLDACSRCGRLLTTDTGKALPRISRRAHRRSSVKSAAGPACAHSPRKPWLPRAEFSPKNSTPSPKKPFHHGLRET